MCIQGTWADAFVTQAVADALNVTTQIAESNQGFAPLTTVYLAQKEILRPQLGKAHLICQGRGGGGVQNQQDGGAPKKLNH